MMQQEAVEKEIRAINKPAIVVNNVTKEFIIPHERKSTLFENLIGMFDSSSYERYTALNHVSLVVQKGDFVGIIGDNGSGKSTLLKIIAHILRPTSGSVQVNGKITPFLELGVGFQMDLTAKENIEVYSTIMGLSEKEIADNLDAVLEFAGLAKFRDTKLKNFSSGMQVRLAFATAVQKVPDILLVDEVLAVGDMDFQQKCLDVFTEYKKKGVTLLFVSHDTGAVLRFCDKAMLIKNGDLLAYGNTGEVIDRYVYGIDKDAANPMSRPKAAGENTGPGEKDTAVAEGAMQEKERRGNGKLTITRVALLDKFGNGNSNFNSGDPMTMNISFRAHEPIERPVFGIAIHDDRDTFYYGTNTEIMGIDTGTVTGEGFVDIKIPSLTLISGRFFITVAVHTRDHVPYDWLDKKYSFTVLNMGKAAGIVDMKSEWAFNRPDGDDGNA